MITPHFVELNITELCNRKCSFCPRAHGYPNLNLNMSIETAELIRDQAKGFVATLHIVGRGEPLLHPDFLNILKVFSKDFKIRIMTNGDKLYKCITEIHNILNLNSRRHRITICLYDDDDQYYSLKKLFKDFSDISYYKTYDTGQATSDAQFNKKHWITNRTGSLYTATKSEPCYIPLNRMYIDWDGSTNLCCHDWTEKATYGNVYESTLPEIYKNIINKYGKELIKGNRLCTKQCSNCDVSSFDPLKFVYKDWVEKQEKRIMYVSEELINV